MTRDRLSRRDLLRQSAGLAGSGLVGGPARATGRPAANPLDPETRSAWLARWERTILAEARARYCDTELGEEIGWKIAQFLQGFCDGYAATRDPRWLDLLQDWTDAWTRRAVLEPDQQPGWPKPAAAGTDVDNLDSFDADSLLGEAMALRPIVLAANAIQNDPTLARRRGQWARDQIEFARQIFTKWNQRRVWRATEGGLITVVLPYGIDRATGRWTEGEAHIDAPGAGFSHPNNKANLVAVWLLAMADVTKEKSYADRAEAWFRVMKRRLPRKPDGTFAIWSYWEPAGPWDFRAPRVPKHWIGVHPNPGYYAIDVQAIVAAYEHGLVFGSDDLEALIKTAIVTERQWPALAPYDATLRQRFEATLDPDAWSAIPLVPWYLSKLRSGPAR